MAMTTALVTVAVCDFCGAKLSHISNDSTAESYFHRARWTIAGVTKKDEPLAVAVACTNTHCRQEMRRTLGVVWDPAGVREVPAT